MTNQTYRAAVIGCGGRGEDHVKAYELIDNANVVACCAPTGRRRDPLAAKYGLSAYADAAEMIRREKPDIVHIATRPDVRVEPMTVVAELGVPLCTVEKPIALGAADWRRLCELEKSSPTRFAVCHQTRWNPHLETCRRAVRSGELGRPLFLHLSAGMNIAGQGTHTLNYGLSLIGDPDVTAVFGNACGWDIRDTSHPAPETTVACLTLAGGVQALWTTGRVSPRCGDPNTAHQHVRAGACCEHGRVEWQQFGRWEVVRDGRVEAGRCYTDGQQFAANWIQEQAAFHRAMFDWLEDDSRPAGTNLGRSLHEWAVVLALYQSALARRPIEMVSFDPPDDLVDRYRRSLV